MNTTILLFLLQDGITNGAIYALLGLALVLVFAVTRVILIPQGEFVTYGALTYASLASGQVPGTAKLAVAMGLVAFAFDLFAARQSLHARQIGAGVRGECRAALCGPCFDLLGSRPIIRRWPSASRCRSLIVAAIGAVSLPNRVPAARAHLGPGAVDRLRRLSFGDAGPRSAVLRRRGPARSRRRRSSPSRSGRCASPARASRSTASRSRSSSASGCSSASPSTARRCAPPRSTGSARGWSASAHRCRARSPSCSPP